MAEISEKIIKSQYINLQGDEPIFPPDQLIKFIKNANKDTSKVHTAITKMSKFHFVSTPGVSNSNRLSNEDSTNNSFSVENTYVL